MINQWMVDTGAWVAFFERSDPWHEVVVSVFYELAQSRSLLYTTDSVILEMVPLLRRFNRSTTEILARVSAVRQHADVLCSSPSDLDQILKRLQSRPSLELSGVDAELLALAEARGVRNILSVDEVFLKLGRFTVRPNWAERSRVLK